MPVSAEGHQDTTALSDEDLWNWAGTIHDEGRSDRHRGRYSLDPTLHLIPKGTNELWCSGGPAVEVNTATRRYCRRCLNLARDMWADLSDDVAEGVDVPFGPESDDR